MKQDYKIVQVTEHNILEHPGCICFINPKNEFFPLKPEWLKKRFKEGLVIKLLYVGEDKKPSAYIEYVPGEMVWRAVDAGGYLFIHCLWVYPNARKHKGFGSILLNEVIGEAKISGKKGVAIMTSDGSFMANQELFLKNGFQVATEAGEDTLLYFPLKKSQIPAFRDNSASMKKMKGIHILYSSQCPWVARFIKEAEILVAKTGLEVHLRELKDPKQAQDAPSRYGVFNLVLDGKLLADRYISITRFKNILKKELKMAL